MASHAFGAFIDMECGSQPVADPPPAVTRTGNSAPTAIELDELSWGSRYNGPSIPQSGAETPYTGSQTPYTGAIQTPKTTTDYLVSRPSTSQRDEAASLVQSWSNPPKNKYRVLSCCLVYLANGLNDSATGALIPYMESAYHIGYAIVSLIFITNALGFTLAAPLTDLLLRRLGRSRALMASEALMVAGYTVLATTPPFSAVVAAFLLLGFAMAVQLAANNVFLANLAGSTVVLGAAHGSYGIGGILGPVVATALVSNGLPWSRYYVLTLGLRLVCLAVAGWSFGGHEAEAATRLLAALERTASRGAPTKRQAFRAALGQRTTLVGALFVFAYQGAEVSISGWVIEFLINYRGGEPAQVGYVTAGFWAGITLGRFALTHLAPRLGEKRFVYALGLGAAALQLLVWLVPNVIGDAVAVGLLGLLLGPVYPCATTVFAALLPRSAQMTSVSFISSAGSSGGAVAPFLTGLLAQGVGTYVLHPVCIGLFAVMLACWFALPKVSKRME